MYEAETISRNGYKITDTPLCVIVTRPNGSLLGNHYATVAEALAAVESVTDSDKLQGYVLALRAGQAI